MPELFAEQVAARPDAVAVECEDAAITYGELDARANRLARHLIGLGVGPETVVGVCLSRVGVELIVALLAVLKAGGAYLPLDPEYPADRLAFMVQDARPVCVLTASELACRRRCAGVAEGRCRRRRRRRSVCCRRIRPM